MARYARKSKRRIRSRVVRPEQADTLNKVSPIAATASPARVLAKSSLASPAMVYDAQKHVVSELKYSLLVGGVLAILLIIAYILFR